MNTSGRLSKSALSDAVPDFCAPMMKNSGRRREPIGTLATPRPRSEQAPPEVAETARPYGGGAFPRRARSIRRIRIRNARCRRWARGLTVPIAPASKGRAILSRHVFAVAAILALCSGCVITTRGRAVASNENEREPSTRPSKPARPHRPAKPAPPKEDPPETTPSSPKPPPSTKPKPPSAKPDPAPKPLPKPPEQAEPKPRPQKPVPKPPEPKPVPPKPEPKPVPPKPEPPKPPPFVPTPAEPQDPPPKPVDNVLFGMPSGLVPQERTAFWIWQDAAGWHLRTTGKGPDHHRFNGRIWVDQGAVIEPAPVTVEGKDRVRTTKQSLEVDFYTFPRIDGIDWKFSGTKCVHFKLLVDEKEQPKLILLGAKKVNPPTAIFSICPP